MECGHFNGNSAPFRMERLKEDEAISKKDMRTMNKAALRRILAKWSVYVCDNDQEPSVSAYVGRGKLLICC